jgi:MFS family permease
VLGACLGALFFGYLTDRFGRRKLFIITLIAYLVATVATAFSGSALFFYASRFFTGAGIGGQYAAINFGGEYAAINFASAGASAAYLTGSEIFPVETRAMSAPASVGSPARPCSASWSKTRRRSTSSTAT